jgi:cytochrome c oxidase subunit 3
MNTYEASTYVPPEIYAVDPFHLPLINTLVLLLSGCAVTWAHHALVHNESRKDVEWGLRSVSFWASPSPGCRRSNTGN